MSLDSSPTPVLPPELERQVFELCAVSRRGFIPKLMLVAWRVKEWVEPILYHTVLIDDPVNVGDGPIISHTPFLSALGRKQPSFFHNAVRNLFLSQFAEDVWPAVLSACTGVENIWLGPSKIADAMHPLLEKLQLKQLYTIPKPLLSAFPPPHSLFSNLTHLEWFPGDTEFAAQSLPLLPRLTHLAFNSPSVCLQMLETCPSLAVLIALDDNYKMTLYAADLLKDVRFVVLHYNSFTEDWALGATMGRDYWHHAEVFIAKRRLGEVDPLDIIQLKGDGFVGCYILVVSK